MLAIPREKHGDDVAREQQRSKHAIRDASVEAAGLKRKREEQYEKAKHTCVLSLHDLSSGCNNVLAHCGLRNAQVPAQCWYL